LDVHTPPNAQSDRPPQSALPRRHDAATNSRRRPRIGEAWRRFLGDELFHPTSLVNFRQRLIEEGLEPLGFQSILDGLVEAGLVARQSRQRLDSTQIFGRISRMSRLECVRETLRLALEESRERFTHHEQVTAGNLQFLQGVVASRPLGFVER
jgi:hypothetical protein